MKDYKEIFFEKYADCAELDILEEVWWAKEKRAKVLNIENSTVTNLRMVEHLEYLRRLFASNTEVNDLVPLKNLKNLEEIDLHNTQISDLSPLVELKNLTRLNISDTWVIDLTPLENLRKLDYLNISDTYVRNLIPLSKLKKLFTVNISNTNVTDLAPLTHLIEKDYFNLSTENCPLIHPPIEIIKQGNEAILRYFRERDRSGTIKIQEARLLLVGQGASGKTTLRRKLLNISAEMPKGEDTTRGIEVEPYQFKNAAGEDFTLQIWDFGGQNIQHHAHQFFLSDSSVYALLSNEREQNPNFQYWLNIIEMLAGRKSSTGSPE